MVYTSVVSLSNTFSRTNFIEMDFEFKKENRNVFVTYKRERIFTIRNCSIRNLRMILKYDFRNSIIIFEAANKFKGECQAPDFLTFLNQFKQ